MMTEAEIASAFAEGVACHHQGQIEKALLLYRKLLLLLPDSAGLLALMGVGQGQMGHGHEGLSWLMRSLRVNPSHAASYCNFGNLLKEKGDLLFALIAYQKSLTLDPGFFEPWMNLGNLLLEEENHEGRVALYLQRAITLAPEAPLARSVHAGAYLIWGENDRAQRISESALCLSPECVEAWINRGVALKELDEAKRALESHDRANRLSPRNIESRVNAAVALNEMREFESALDRLQGALALFPDNAKAHLNLGIVSSALHRFDQALDAYDRALLLMAKDQTGGDSASWKRKSAEVRVVKGFALSQMQLFDEALQQYDSALKADSTYAEANWNRSLLHILRGEYAEGWRLYEWRFQMNPPPAVLRDYPVPRLLGQPVDGRTILIYPEQGLGDQIQFARYAMVLADQGAKVLLEVRAPLKSILKNMDSRIHVFAEGEDLPSFDLHTPLMSLPMLLGTTTSTIPWSGAYLSPSEPAMPLDYHPSESGSPRVGLVWSGSRTHKNDQNRSIPLLSFQELLRLPLDYLCLQKELRSEDAECLAASDRIRFIGDQLEDFCETARWIMTTDLVISVDTSVAHLAAALGKPVWILLPFMPDYRWMLYREDSPWYPTVTLFRQDETRDWSLVIERVGAALKKRYEL